VYTHGTNLCTKTINVSIVDVLMKLFSISKKNINPQILKN